MPRSGLAVSPVLVSCILVVSCASPAAPTASGPLDEFVRNLRQQGLTVTVGGQIAPQDNRFFSVPAQEIRVNDAQVNAQDVIRGLEASVGAPIAVGLTPCEIGR